VAQPIAVRGLYETHLSVRDLPRSIDFYRGVVGLELAAEFSARKTAFFWIGGRERSMLGLWEIGTSPVSLHLHIAFEVSRDDVLAAPSRLRAAGVTPLSFELEETDEPSVIGWMPAASVFFADPDGHSLEYIALLDEEPRGLEGAIPYSQWVRSGA
jgi:lactoylglutathione lyase